MAFMTELGRITDFLGLDSGELLNSLEPDSVFGVSGKADRSRGVPFISSCGSYGTRGGTFVGSLSVIVKRKQSAVKDRGSSAEIDKCDFEGIRGYVWMGR